MVLCDLKMPKKEEFISKEDQTNLALVTAGCGTGVATPMILKLYADPEFPDGLPYIKEVVPMPWSAPSVFVGLCAGAVAIIGGIFIKPIRYFLLPFGITSLSTGVMLGLTTPPPLESGRQRVPGNLRRVPGNQNISGNIKLVSAGSLKSPSPGGSNFMQKNPEQRLIQLQKDESDAKLQEEIKKMEEQKKFRDSGASQGIPLRT